MAQDSLFLAVILTNETSEPQASAWSGRFRFHCMGHQRRFMLFDKPIYAIMKNKLKDNVIAYKNKIRNLMREKMKSG